jgi:carboxyl-terminal processing protease
MNRLAFALVLVLFRVVLAQACNDSAKTDLMSRQERTHLFSEVWTTVYEEYIYPDYRGADWEALKKEYGKQILSVKTNEDFYRIIDEMILELNDDHSAYLSPWLSCEEDSYATSDDTNIDEPVVTRLEQNSEVLLIKLPSFNLYDTGERLESQLRRTLQKGPVGAIILDLRHNYGGYIDAAYSVLSNFVQGRLATEFDLYSKTPVRGEPGLFYSRFAKVPVVVLIDGETHSAAELTAGVLQQARGAVVIGQASAGNTEFVLPFDFEDGSRLWLAIGGFTLADGTSLEGVGVIPDITINRAAKDEAYLEAGLGALGLGKE